MRPRLPTGTTPSPLGGENLYSFWPREPAGGYLFTAESPVQFNFLEIKLPFRKAVGAPQPPKHLKPATRAWFASVCEDMSLMSITFACSPLPAKPGIVDKAPAQRSRSMGLRPAPAGRAEAIEERGF